MSLFDSTLGRRDFLKGAVTAAAGAAVLGGMGGVLEAGAQETAQQPDGDLKPHAVASDAAILENQGEWKSLACYEHCGGACVNKGYMVDGVIVRQTNDDAFEDTRTMPQTRGCIRGRSLRQQFYNVDRLKYPMKRKHWQPGGGENSHGELRGKDEWERISWDEALDLVAGEIMRVERDYGPSSVVSNGWWYFQGVNVLHAAGGCVTLEDTESYGTWHFRLELLGLDMNAFILDALPHAFGGNNFADLANTDSIVFYSCNPAWTLGNELNFVRRADWFKEKQIVVVGPSCNVSAQMINAKWIPVRVGTDTAFNLAVMYEMIRMEQEGQDVIDHEFLDKYTVGYDLEHLPLDAALEECISEYVMGAYDGIPKTPEWASEICGTPVEDITWYAEMMSKQHNVTMIHGYASSRCNGAENLPQALLTVMCMGGHLGKPGNSFAAHFGNMGLSTGRPVSAGMARTNPLLPNPMGKNFAIQGPMYWKSLLDGSYMSYCEDYIQNDPVPEVNCHEGREMPVTPRILFQHQANFLQSRQDMGNGIKAMRAAELCVAMDIKTTLTAQYSDIILPCCTAWEYNNDSEDGPIQWPPTNFGGTLDTCENALRARMPVAKPIYEARQDQWIYRELVKRMGVDPDVVYPFDEKSSYFDSLLGATYTDLASGETKPIVNWTEEQSQEWGIDMPAQEGAVEIDQLMRDGKFAIDFDIQDPAASIVNYAAFMEDPEANPLPSNSGKFELYCQLKADNYNVMGYNPEPIKPYANYIVPVLGYEESFSDWENKVKGEFPLQMYTPHYQRRAHTAYDNLAWTQEAFVNPVFMNADDAAERGLADGDSVEVYSPYGRIVRRLTTLQSMMPGHVAIPHGAHSQIDESDPEHPVDLGGNENILYGPVRSNYMPNLDNYNTNLVEVKKWDGGELPWDCDREPFTAGTVVAPEQVGGYEYPEDQAAVVAAAEAM